jgi:hypothetical protein
MAIPPKFNLQLEVKYEQLKQIQCQKTLPGFSGSHDRFIGRFLKMLEL